MPVKLTQKQVEDFISDKGGRLLSKYNGTREKITIQCLKDNHIWSAVHNNIVCGQWCPKCANNIPVEFESVKKLVELKNGIVLNKDDFKNARSKISIQCMVDNHVWKTTYDHISHGSWCPKCANRIPYEKDFVINYIIERDGTPIKVPDIIRNNTSITIKCNKDGYIWSNTFSSIKCRGSWCAKCSGRGKLSRDEVLKSIDNKNCILISMPDKFTNTTKITIQCKKDKCVWVSQLSHIRVPDRYFCPQCTKNRATEKQLFEILREIFGGENIRYNNYPFEWLKHNGKLQLDFWIPDVQLAIEYDGQQHFFPVRFNSISEEKAKENFQVVVYHDQLKNQLIQQHPDDVKYFVRFNYKESITKEYVISKLKEYGIPIP